MTVAVSTLLGVVFLALSVLATFTMYRFWGYPYDKETRTSACPRWKMNVHRALGYAYVILYVVFMIEMLPRLWAYQVEFPARTVAHICLGISIGVILLVKISIVRWFRHFEEWMPVLGTLLMLCTFLLVGLSAPFLLKERALASGALGGGAFTSESRERVARLLPEAGFSDEVDLDSLSSERNLRRGRRVLLNQCVYCHDLKTAIASPRTPAAWRRTVRRMAEKPTLGAPITVEEQHRVTAYLIAITPELQRSEAERRQVTLEREGDRQRVEEVLPRHGPARPAPEPDDDATVDDATVDDATVDDATVDDATPEKASERPPRRAGDRPERRPREPRSPPAEPSPAPADAGVRDPAEDAITDAGAVGGEPEEDTAAADRAAEARETFERKCAQCHGLEDVHTAPPASAGEAREIIHRMVEHGLSASERELQLIEEHMVRRYVDR